MIRTILHDVSKASVVGGVEEDVPVDSQMDRVLGEAILLFSVCPMRIKSNRTGRNSLFAGSNKFL
jgi:hypothetical protein